MNEEANGSCWTEGLLCSALEVQNVQYLFKDLRVYQPYDRLPSDVKPMVLPQCAPTSMSCLTAS